MTERKRRYYVPNVETYFIPKQSWGFTLHKTIKSRLIRLVHVVFFNFFVVKLL